MQTELFCIQLVMYKYGSGHTGTMLIISERHTLWHFFLKAFSSLELNYCHIGLAKVVV